jgi:dihydroflavonol-4-reductase
VGSHTVEAYLDAGWKVRAFVRDPNRLAWLNDLDIEIAVGALTSQHSLYEAVADCDTVIHCAGMTKALNSEDLFRVNGDAVGWFVEAAREQGVKRFVLCSSQAAAGPSSSDKAIDEDDEPNPISVYGASKLKGERLLKELSGSMQWVILRPSAIIGPRDWQFLPLFQGIKKLGLYPRFGSGSQLYSYICVFDVARALLLAGEINEPTNRTYFVAQSDPVDWKDASQIIGEFAHRKVRNLVLPVRLARMIGVVNDGLARFTKKPALLGREKVSEILASGWICSVRKIEQEWGFKCDYDLESTLRVTYDFYRNLKKL